MGLLEVAASVRLVELGFCQGTSPDYLWFEPCQGKMKRLFLVRACVVSELVNLLHTAPPSDALGNAAFSGTTTTKMDSLFLHLDLELSG